MRWPPASRSSRRSGAGSTRDGDGLAVRRRDLRRGGHGRGRRRVRHARRRGVAAVRRGGARAGTRDRRGRGRCSRHGPRRSAPVPPLSSRGSPSPSRSFEVEWRSVAESDPVTAAPAARRRCARCRRSRSSRGRGVGPARARVGCGAGRRPPRRVRPRRTGRGQDAASSRSSRAHVAADGATVLFGACREGGGPPYGPVIDALEHLLAHADDLGIVDADAERARTLLQADPRRTDNAPELSFGQDPRAARLPGRHRPRRRRGPAARRCCSCSTTSSGRAGRRCSWCCTGSASPLPLRVCLRRDAPRDAGRHQRHVRRRARRVPPARGHHARAGRGLRPRGRRRVRRGRVRRADRRGPRACGRGARRNRPTATRSCSASCGATSSRPARSCRTARSWRAAARRWTRSTVPRASARSSAGASTGCPATRAICSRSRRSPDRRSRSTCCDRHGTEPRRRARAARARDRERDRSRSSAPARSGSRTRSCGARSTTD